MSIPISQFIPPPFPSGAMFVPYIVKTSIPRLFLLSVSCDVHFSLSYFTRYDNLQDHQCCCKWHHFPLSGYVFTPRRESSQCPQDAVSMQKLAENRSY